MMRRFTNLHLLACFSFFFLITSIGQAQILFDNGPIFNSPGTGSGGANESMLYTTTFGMSTIGFGHQSTAFNRVADDFAIDNCRWRIDSIVFFGYQTGSTTTSTFTAVNFRIWDSIPDASGSSVVFGDTLTNRLTASRWSGVYRITETTHLATNRPIMRNVCALNNLVLTNGNYWIDWQSSGSLASGPWAPARTPMNLAITGNGRQRVGNTWNNLVDGGTGTPAQGLPFIIYGTILDPVADAGADQSVCPGNAAMIGGSPSGSGGLGSLSYSWSPGSALNDSLLANPIASPSASTSYVLSVTDSTGCTVFDTVSVNVGATASNFLVSDTTICFGSNIVLDAGTGNSYLWSTQDTTQTIIVGPGTYYVDVDNGSGCNSTDTVVVTSSVNVQIVGNTLFCGSAGDTLCTQQPFATYTWSNGATAPCIVVFSSDIITITTTDNFGCVSVDTLGVTAMPGPGANFSFSVGAAGLTYDFTDGSTNATSWSWNFGDTGTSTQQNPSHTYASSGNYTVTLVVTNQCGSDTITQTVAVVGIAGTLPGATVSVGPVPASKTLRYQVHGLEQGSLEVAFTDLQGRVLSVWNHSDAQLGVDSRVEVGGFARGMYLLRFRSGDHEVVRKVTLE